jgi:phage repressor protein C with HTH and peptisase S24 domain
VEGSSTEPRTLNPEPSSPVNLDDIFLSGVLQELVEKSAGNVEQVGTNAVPVINRVSAGYPRDFTDLSYPKGVADDYVSCPDVHDQDAFAARVHGDSMSPKYGEGDIVIFSPAAGPKSGDDCFVRFEDGQTTFKRVFFENDEAGTPSVRLQPRNERYRPQIVPSERITGLYKAMFRYQRVDQD